MTGTSATLARPGKRNAQNPLMWAELARLGAELVPDETLRCLVVTGEGSTFSAGIDLAAGMTGMLAGLAEGPDDEHTRAAGRAAAGTFPSARSCCPARGRTSARAWISARSPRCGTASGSAPWSSCPRASGLARAAGQRAAYVWTEIPVPVIAAVTGNALGGGLQIALGADIRIVAPDARMSVLEIRWGLVPDMTGSQLLPELVGRDVAKELTFSGRVVGGEEAVALGLATRVDPDPRKAALELARSIAGRNPHAIRAAKRLLDLAGRVDLETGFAAEQEEIGALIGSPN